MRGEPPNDNNPSIVGAASRLGQSLVGALPPGFLGLCVINVIFVALVMWFLNAQLAQRTRLVDTLVTKCMDIALHAPAPPH